MFQTIFDVKDDDTTLSSHPTVVLVNDDPQTPQKDLGVAFDKKVRWRITPTNRAVGPKDVWVRANIYTYAVAFLRMYHIDVNAKDKYSVTLDSYWNLFEM